MSADIAAKLAAAVKDDSTVGDVQEALDKPVGTDPKQSAETTDKGQKAKSQAVPYDRFKEKVDALDKAAAKIDELTERDKEQAVKLAQLESDHDVLERLRGLAGDDRYSGLVQTLDKALRGIHEDVKQGDKTEKQADVATKDLFNEHKAELEDAFATQRADLLWQQAQSISERMLEDLGEDYDANDIEAIAKLWNPATDWDAIEVNPDSMRQELLESLKTVVESYGEPRGALKAKVKQFEEKTQQTQETTPVQSQEESLKGLLEKDWGKVKTNADGKVLGPELSDEDFQATLAKVMRMGRRS
jgi:hypothetical protein